MSIKDLPVDYGNWVSIVCSFVVDLPDVTFYQIDFNFFMTEPSIIDGLDTNVPIQRQKSIRFPP